MNNQYFFSKINSHYFKDESSIIFTRPVELCFEPFDPGHKNRLIVFNDEERVSFSDLMLA